MIPELVIVALDFYREPRRFPHLTDPRYPLPAGVADLLTTPANVLSDQHIEETAATLNATVNECRELVPFFIKQALLDSGGDYYRILGLPNNANASQIKKHYHYLIRLFHPDRDVSDDNWDELYAPRINEAYNVLRNENKRSRYDEGLLAERNAGFAPAGEQQRATQTRARHKNHNPAINKSGMSPQAKKLALGLLVIVVIGFTMLIMKQSRQPTLRVAASGERTVEVSSPGNTNTDQNISKTNTLHTTEAVDPAEEETSQVDVMQQAVEQQKEPSMEEIIRLRVEKATVAVVGHPMTTVSVREVKVKPPKKVSPAAVKPAVNKVEEQKTSDMNNVAMSKTDVAHENTVKDKNSVKNTDVAVSKKVVTIKTVEKTKASNQPVKVVVSQQNDQQIIPKSVTEGIHQSFPENIPPTISSEQLFKILAVLISSYEAGDLDRFVDLFAEDAGTTDGNGKLAIYNLYKEYFARPEQRKMSITQFRWKDNGSNGKNGSGDVHLVTIPLDGSVPTNGGGPLRLDVQLYPAGLKIKGMYYEIKTK